MRNLKKYDSCYAKQVYNGRAYKYSCKGLFGGSSATNYLQESCVECPYLVLPAEIRECSGKNGLREKTCVIECKDCRFYREKEDESKND